MWVQEKDTGKFQFFERYVNPVSGQHKTVSILLDRNTTASRKAAQAALKTKIAKRLKTTGPYDDMTLAELRDLYLKRKGIRTSSKRRDDSITSTIVATLGADTLINRLSANYIKTCLEESGKDERPELVTRIKAFLRWGFRNDYIQNVSFLDKLEKQLPEDHEITERFLEEDELKTLLEALDVREWKELTEFLALTGLRIGEALDLKISDIGEDKIRVTSTADLKDHSSGPTKTRAGVREVVITNEVRDCIRRIRTRKFASRMLFVAPNGRPVNYPAYLKYLRICSNKALGRKVTPHMLRHTYTSLMAAAGVPLEVISRQLGHEDSKITREVYFHVTKKLKERDADMIRNVSLLA